VLLGGTLVSPSGAYAQTSYTPQQNGQLIAFPANTNRITNLGFFVDRAATNYCLWSRDLTNAVWTSVNVTAAKSQSGLVAGEAANQSSLLTSSAINSTCLQSITLTSGLYAASAYIKRVTGTGTISMTMDGITYTDITSQLNTSTWTWVQIPTQTLTACVMGFKFGTSGDAIAVDMCQVESTLGSLNIATTPLPCGASTQSRLNEQDEIGTNNSKNDGQAIVKNIMNSGKPWTMFMSYNGDSSGCMYVSDFTLNVSCNGGCGGDTLYINSRAAQTANSGNSGRGNWNKAAYRVNGQKASICLNGGAIVTYTNANFIAGVSGTSTHLNLGTNGSGSATLTLCGSIGKVFWLDKECTDGEMIENTTLYNNVP